MTRVFDFPVRYLARNYFHKRLAVFYAHCSETGGGRQKTAKISFDGRLEIQNFLDGVEACSAEGLQESVRGHRPRVPVSRFYFIERISDDPVIAATAGANNIQTF